MIDPAELPEGFSFSLLPENWDKIMPYFEQAAEIFPVLRDAPIRRFVNGPEASRRTVCHWPGRSKERPASSWLRL